MGAYQLAVAIPSTVAPTWLAAQAYVGDVFGPYKDYWFSYFDLGEWAGPNWEPMSYIDLDGKLYSQHLPDKIAGDGEKGDYIPLDQWRSQFNEWVDSLPQGVRVQNVKVKW